MQLTLFDKITNINYYIEKTHRQSLMGEILMLLFSRDQEFFNCGPTSNGAILRSKLVDGRWQVQSPADLGVRGFPWFSLKLT